VFTVEERARIRSDLIDFAKQDPRVVAGAEVGSLTIDAGDRWSDLDLTFGLTDETEPAEVLDGWTVELGRRWDAVRLFDLAVPPTLYRVFLFPGNLQVDLSAAPGAVAKRGPNFQMLFGRAIRDEATAPPEARELYGLCVHYALRVRVSVERGRYWAAEYWISELRHETLSLAALLRGLPSRYGRGFHELPADLTRRAEQSLVSNVERDTLLRALSSAIDLFVDVASDLDDAPSLNDALRDLKGDGG
jgi:hypothetical protein